ncbi:MAG TPA: glycosyltransferase [Candidatus Saccharimonadales bacterium]|nr:glycosyltransferase [Candidatus Saccharimonadales bacterium]
MTNEIDLSIIIPAYQEAKRIGGTLERLAQFLKTKDYGSVEVLVVTATSSDGTDQAALAKAKLFQNFRLVDLGPRVGKGRDVRAGIFEARGRYKMFMDADLATPLVHLDDIQAIIRRGGQVGIAVRNLTSSHTGLRKLISSFGNVLVQILLLPGIKDTQCGFKLFEAQAATEIFSRQTVLGWGFDMEILAIARKLGYKIEFIEAPDWQDVAGGTFSNVAVTGALDTLKDLLYIKWRMITRGYNQKKFVYEPHQTR